MALPEICLIFDADCFSGVFTIIPGKDIMVNRRRQTIEKVISKSDFFIACCFGDGIFGCM